MAENISAALSWQLADAVRSMTKDKTEPSTGTATVIGADSSGLVTVLLPGASQPTPVNGDIVASAQPGERVRYEIRNGRLSIVGNSTSPSVGGTYVNQAVAPAERKADEALVEASRAKNAADIAEAEAVRAHVAADSAQDSADTAAGAASAAQASADDALTSARSANASASSALTQLSIVEDVSGTLSWIRDHGTYQATTDTTVQEDTVYFELVSGDYVPISSPDPTANPQSSGWYVLDVTDSQTDYIMAHLAVTSAGLWVLPSGIGQAADAQHAAGYKVLLASTGMTVYDGTGTAVVTYGSSTTYYVHGSQVASFGSTITIGGESDANIHIDSDSIDMRDGSDTLLTIEADVPAQVYYNKESALKMGGTNPASIQMYTNSANDNRKITIDSGYNSCISAIHYDQYDVHGSYGGYDFVKVAGDGILIGKTGYADMGQAAKCLNIQSGTMGVGTVNAGSYKDVSITFPAYYDAAPIVVVGFATTSVDGSFGKCCVAVYSTSATGFVARVYNGDNWARSPRITWIAMP